MRLPKPRSAARAENPYDLAILDMQMPEMDGMQLARAIKEDGLIPPMRLILLSSMGQRGDASKAREAGISAYLTKPAKQSELYDAIAEVMGLAAPEREEGAGLVTRHSILEGRSGSGFPIGRRGSPAQRTGRASVVIYRAGLGGVEESSARTPGDRTLRPPASPAVAEGLVTGSGLLAIGNKIGSVPKPPPQCRH